MTDSLTSFLIGLKNDKLISTGLNVCNAFCPTLLAIFLFDNKMFQNLDTIKLIIVCFSIGLPFLLISLFVSHRLADSTQRVIRSVLESKNLDKYSISAEKIDMVTKSISTRLTCGLVGSACWLLTGFVIMITYLVKGNISLISCGYLGGGTYIILIIILSTIISSGFYKLASKLDNKNDEDYSSNT